MHGVWSEDQVERRREVIEFARRELPDDDLVARDRDGRFSRELWDKCAEFGVLGLSVPKEYGGAEVDLLTAMAIMEGLGYACADNGLTFALNAQMWTVQLPIVRFGTEEQKHRFLPDLCSGRILAAHALTEPEAGSDAFSLAMRAERSEGGYVLNGVKRLITMAPIADLAIVFAATDPDAGAWGISVFIVERRFEGYTAKPVQDKMGLRTVPLGELVLDECFVPEENRLGPEGAGVGISTHSLEIERCCILSSQLGAMERQLEASIAYAKARVQFDRPIGRFQSVSNRIVDMKLRLETARLLLQRVASLKQAGRPAMMEAALLKLHLSEGFVESGLDAIRIHGGVGYLSETGVERDLRDAIGGVLYAGTSDIQRNIVARLLGL